MRAASNILLTHPENLNAFGFIYNSIMTIDQTGKSGATMPAVNRTFKSTVFIMLFEDKRNLLELYNAISGKHYTDPELLEINTLENAIYMSIKNDVSFLIDGRLSLYEHQSTYNPNLPLRFLLYIANQYASITKAVSYTHLDVYKRQVTNRSRA